MSYPQPRALNRRRVARLLSEATSTRSASVRIDHLSRSFLGHSYQPNPLIGSSNTPEVFTASLDGFDCVTYIETVLALARAKNVDDFIACLRKIRYEKGRIQWKRRNHYMTRWISNNVREGLIRPISVSPASIVRIERVLDVVPGLAALPAVIKCVPKRAMPRLVVNLSTGDLIFFVSTRKHLDVFHAGIVVRNDKSLLMRHASRSHGSVVEQDLGEFLKANRMAGVIVMRPREVARRNATDN